jgi:hypothetical protein
VQPASLLWIRPRRSWKAAARGPGSVVASCVWDYAGEMTLLRAFLGRRHARGPSREPFDG